jgi:hypothetical protein
MKLQPLMVVHQEALVLQFHFQYLVFFHNKDSRPNYLEMADRFSDWSRSCRLVMDCNLADFRGSGWRYSVSAPLARPVRPVRSLGLGVAAILESFLQKARIQNDRETL